MAAASAARRDSRFDASPKGSRRSTHRSSCVGGVEARSPSVCCTVDAEALRPTRPSLSLTHHKPFCGSGASITSSCGGRGVTASEGGVRCGTGMTSPLSAAELVPAEHVAQLLDELQPPDFSEKGMTCVGAMRPRVASLMPCPQHGHQRGSTLSVRRTLTLLRAAGSLTHGCPMCRSVADHRRVVGIRAPILSGSLAG
jgi:hypothetical protein